MRGTVVLCGALLAAVAAASAATNVSLNPNALGKPPIDSWPTFNGDYSGQRYSTLKQITAANVGRLAQQWTYKITGVGPERGVSVPTIKCTPLLVDGVLYITIPDHVWAIDARTGKDLWRYDWVAGTWWGSAAWESGRARFFFRPRTTG